MLDRWVKWKERVLSDPSLTLEQWLFQRLCLMAGLIAIFVIVPVNNYPNLSPWVNRGIFAFGLGSLAIAWAAWRGHYLKKTFLLAYVACLDLIWFPNGGSQGSIGLYFVTMALYLVLFFDWIPCLVGVALLVANAIGLLMAEQAWPHLVVPFNSTTDRLVDLASGYLISLPVSGLMLGIVLWGFRLEGKRSGQALQSLQAAEAALRESEERLRLAMEATHDGFWDWKVATGEIFLSPTYHRMLGHETDPLPQRVEAWVALLHPDDREQVLAGIQDCIEGIRPNFEIEHRIRTREGGFKWILGRGHAVSRDDQGRALRMAGTTVDITARKQAEEALRVSEDKLARIFQMSPDAIDLVRTTDRVCLDFNEAFSNLFGYTREEFIGKPLLPVDFDTWVNLEDRDRLMASLREHGMVLGFETPCRRKDGSIFISEISVAALEIAGQPCHLSFTRDVTGRKQAEEDRSRLRERLLQAQKLEALGGMVSGVAHNMNNVLAIIMGTASLRESRATDPLDIKAFGTIGKVSSRGRDVVKSLIHFAEPALSIQEPFELNGMVREVCALLGGTTMNRIRVIEALAVEPLWVFGDAGSINLALMNICSNAIYAMPGGGILALGTAILEAGWVEVSVGDNGAGMTPEVLARLMEPFYTTRDVGQGTGLGLCMTYGAMKAHGGTIDIASEPGRGTTVKLRFPRIPAPVQIDGNPGGHGA